MNTPPDLVLSKDQEEHFEVLLQALSIYLDRDETRGDLWRSRPPSKKIEMVREKMDRAESALTKLRERNPANIEEYPALIHEIFDGALDSINFCVFLIREVREGQVD